MTPRPSFDPQRAGMPGKVASAVLGLQALALVGFAVFYLLELVIEGSDHATSVIMSAVVILVFAIGLVVIARALVQGVRWARTGTVVWNALLLPVAWSLIQSGQAVAGTLIVVLALVAIVGVAVESKERARARLTCVPRPDAPPPSSGRW